jgi:type 1 glutamine amidotransferase
MSFMKILTTLILGLCCIASLTLGKSKPPTIVFVLAEREYKTAETVPAFYEKHLKPLGFVAKYVTAPPSGPERDNLKGLDTVLKDADLVFLSVRRRAPKIGQLKAIQEYLSEGKPLVGIRTASHPFDIKKNESPEGYAQWKTFDPDVLGGSYNGHHGKQKTHWKIEVAAKDHVILKGVSLESQLTGGSLYRSAPLAKSTTTLATASAEGIPQSQPVAWTNQPKDGNRIFYTSLGHVSDFENEQFVKMLTNAVLWATNTKAPCK